MKYSSNKSYYGSNRDQSLHATFFEYESEGSNKMGCVVVGLFGLLVTLALVWFFISYVTIV